MRSVHAPEACITDEVCITHEVRIMFRRNASLKKRTFVLVDKSAFFVGADDEARTRYLHLGKVALYQMSYIRILRVTLLPVVPPVGIEPTTRGFSVLCSTN